MTNSRLRQTLKESAIALEEGGAYQEARDNEFDRQFSDFVEDIQIASFTEEDVRGFMMEFDDNFPDEETWIGNEVESEYGDYCDQAYEQMKDER